jgi:N-dimethylarginine dimethylaminohydrolase
MSASLPSLPSMIRPVRSVPAAPSVQARVYTRMNQVPDAHCRVLPGNRRVLDLDTVPDRTLHEGVLMVEPDYYANSTGINEVGTSDPVDLDLFLRQHEAVQAFYRELGRHLLTVPGAPQFPDMVFSANQSISGQLPDGSFVSGLSNMRYSARQGEELLIGAGLQSVGFQLERIPDGIFMEGMGDALWVPGKRMIVGGYGHRTDLEAYEHLSRLLGGVMIFAVETLHPFYHNDLVLSLLRPDEAMYYPEAYTAASQALLSAIIPKLFRPDNAELEALTGAFNCHCPDGDGVHVGIDPANVAAMRALESRGYTVVGLNLSEAMKAGGNLYCLKNEIPVTAAMLGR